MNKNEAKNFKERWQIVNKVIAEEIRQTPAEVKLRQLAVMVEAAQMLGWAESLREGEEEVRERWRKLKKSDVA